ncbi:MAG: hypothetical protein EBR05_09715 [Marivivens sp.]|jgi:hypothetical protein|uniref:DUF6455 family protein n=1 Tax=Marivivens sp. TaxID=1978374 RepID=UPI00201E939D|nr:DUF6455 family protein [Marivivens sp.]MCL7406694.1 DUF6455 family protein [Marivivens geojensis]NBQ51500.1 hypothetical protein [Marivivens sp.]NBT52879.1 hypothetical protein [Marivivens sp.]NBX10062.1 hypothetical protein [Marivivens sp.]NCW70138.1 hypothetical protein [Marivivens sp.]
MSFVSQVIDRVREHARIDAEVDNLDVNDLNGLGLTRGEMRKIAHMPQEQIDRMEKMAGVFDVKVDSLRASGEQVEVVRRCACCGENGACKSALANGASAEEMTFCPNASTYRAHRNG